MPALPPNVVESLQRALNGDIESVPDEIACPTPGCGNQLTLRLRSDHALLSCDECGWKETITKEAREGGDAGEEAPKKGRGRPPKNDAA